uniref:Uncharacterized protein n=1 Tax=Arundo donax TaxID=35708 RepID=A0A0A8YEX5_ARUDO
MGLEEKAEKN